MINSRLERRPREDYFKSESVDSKQVHDYLIFKGVINGEAKG